MYMKSLVSLAVLGAMSAVATAGDPVVFDNPNESYTVDGLNIFGATINASDITITNTAPASNGITAYGDFKLNAANDISIQGTQNGIFTPDDHANPSITIKTPKLHLHLESVAKVLVGDKTHAGSEVDAELFASRALRAVDSVSVVFDDDTCVDDAVHPHVGGLCRRCQRSRSQGGGDDCLS